MVYEDGFVFGRDAVAAGVFHVKDPDADFGRDVPTLREQPSITIAESQPGHSAFVVASGTAVQVISIG